MTGKSRHLSDMDNTLSNKNRLVVQEVILLDNSQTLRTGCRQGECGMVGFARIVIIINYVVVDREVRNKKVSTRLIKPIVRIELTA